MESPAISPARGPAVLAAPRPPRPAHVTVATALRQPRLEDRALAAGIFGLLRGHPRTLAVVVMPEHVHWLLSDDSGLATVVTRFKQESQALSAAAGDSRSLWQRSFFDTPVTSDRLVRLSAGYLLANPIAAGLVARWQDYPWAFLAGSLRSGDLGTA